MSPARTIEINPARPTPRRIQEVVDVLRQGGVICYPTDTVYGIGCDIYNNKAVKRIFQIKRRAKEKPFSLMCADFQEMNNYCHISNMAYRLMRKNLPGPYTFILPAAKLVPKIMVTRQKTVGIRVPNHSLCREMITTLGNAILTTSAILPGDEGAMSNACDIEDRIGTMVDLVVDGGALFPDPSTVISLVGDQVEILRAGKGDLSPFG